MDLPEPRDFRQWIKQVLTVLDLTGYRWSREAGVPPNLVSKLLSGEQTDLRLSAACALVRIAQKTARDQGIALPPLKQHRCLSDLGRCPRP
jgi:predicted transcriptional regulator